MKDDLASRREITNIYRAKYRVYDLEEPVVEEIEYVPLTYDKSKKRGAYIMRMGAGTTTAEHTHLQNEDFLILEGDLIEPDGLRLGPGDFVHYKPGSRHNSRTETGCLLIGFDWS